MSEDFTAEAFGGDMHPSAIQNLSSPDNDVLVAPNTTGGSTTTAGLPETIQVSHMEGFSLPKNHLESSIGVNTTLELTKGCDLAVVDDRDATLTRSVSNSQLIETRTVNASRDVSSPIPQSQWLQRNGTPS